MHTCTDTNAKYCNVCTHALCSRKRTNTHTHIQRHTHTVFFPHISFFPVKSNIFLAQFTILSFALSYTTEGRTQLAKLYPISQQHTHMHTHPHPVLTPNSSHAGHTLGQDPLVSLFKALRTPLVPFFTMQGGPIDKRKG